MKWMELLVFPLLEFLKTKRNSYYWFLEWLLWRWNLIFKNKSIDFSLFMKRFVWGLHFCWNITWVDCLRVQSTDNAEASWRITTNSGNLGPLRATKSFEEAMKDLVRWSAQRTPPMLWVTNSAQCKGMAGMSRAASLGWWAVPKRCFLLMEIVLAEISSLARIRLEQFSVPWTLLARGLVVVVVGVFSQHFSLARAIRLAHRWTVRAH